MGGVDIFRDAVSLDWDDALTLVLALIAVAGVFITRKTQSETRATTETIDGDVLSQFRQLFEKITTLEAEVAAQRVSLEQARAEIKEMRKLEEFLQAKVHEREQQLKEVKEQHDREVKNLRSQLKAARRRISHLEAVCRRAGINGEEIENAEV